MREMKEQVPTRLQRWDDSSGIAWRVMNKLKRFNVARTARFWVRYLRPLRYERPIFVIGAPRSGTTMLFHLLRESSHLGALPHEGHDVWRMYHHPRYSGWRSDAVGAGQARFGERRYVNAYFGSYFSQNRFVEKTPENSLRIPYLLDLFPDALFVIIKRNPCDVINSLINGWRHPKGRFRSYYVPDALSIPDYPNSHRWCFALIEGWRDFRTAPIPEIACAQWEQCTQAVEAARSLVPPARWREVYFEDILASPEATMERLYADIDIPNEPALQQKLASLMTDPVNALSPPGKDKWRRDNLAEITALLPRIAATARATGYEIDTATGECTTQAA